LTKDGDMLPVVLMLIGFLLLIKGADLLVQGAAAAARRIGVSDLTIGLTVVGFGTSTPELVVNIMAGVQGTTALAIGNVLGSNIANVFLILGVTALILPLEVTSQTVWREIPMSLLAAIVLAILANDQFLDGEAVSLLARSDGLVFLCFFSVFLYYTVAATLQVQGAAGYAPSAVMGTGKAVAFPDRVGRFDVRRVLDRRRRRLRLPVPGHIGVCHWPDHRRWAHRCRSWPPRW
jgi:Ca2+/Na+ antiporter